MDEREELHSITWWVNVLDQYPSYSHYSVLYRNKCDADREGLHHGSDAQTIPVKVIPLDADTGLKKGGVMEEYVTEFKYFGFWMDGDGKYKITEEGYGDPGSVIDKDGRVQVIKVLVCRRQLTEKERVTRELRRIACAMSKPELATGPAASGALEDANMLFRAADMLEKE